MGVNMDRFSLRPLKAPDGCLQILSVARLTEKKGLHVAIEACRQLKERGVNFRYRILGIGPWERRLRTLIEQYQLEDHVEMPGFKPSHEVKMLLDEADVFLLPSVTGADGDMEGIPVALMEAMAVGIPVLSTVHSGIPELIDSGHSGWWRSTTPRRWRTSCNHLAGWMRTACSRCWRAHVRKSKPISISR
ncbi:hypothetical protein ESCOCK405M_22805 [Escherichia coli]